MRLCLVISSLAAGGAERVMSILAGEWAARGHEVLLLTTHDGGSAPHYPVDARVELRSVDPRTGGGMRRQMATIGALRRAIAAARPAVVVSFLNYTNILVLLACRNLDVPVVVSERLDPRIVGIGPVWSMLRRMTYRRACCLVAQTTAAGALYGPLVHGRVRVIPNPVPPPPEVTPVPDWPDPHRPTIMAVGRLQPQKDYETALQAMAILGRSNPEWRLVILGDGPLRGSLERLRDDLGLGTTVQFAGRVATPAAWLRRADMYLLSSRSEGFPNALCEAMMLGLPCVSTDCPSGPADIITHGVDGWLVPVGEPTAIADALSRLAGDPAERARLAAQAPVAMARFSVPSVLAEWDRLFEAVVVAPRAPQHRTRISPDGSQEP